MIFIIGIIREIIYLLTKVLLGNIFKCGNFHYAEWVNIFILFFSLVSLPYCTSLNYYSPCAINNKIALWKYKWKWIVIHLKVTKFISPDGDTEIDE